MDAMFSPQTAAAVARARQHSVGDLLHRSAARYPDKLAVVAGDLRVSYAEFDAAVNRTAHALAARGLAKGDRLALLSHNCWQYVCSPSPPPGSAWSWSRSTSCSAPRKSPSSSPLAGPAAWSPRPPWPVPPRRRWQRRGTEGGLRGWIGPAPAAGWEDVDPWWQSGDDTMPDVPIADDDPLRLMYTSGTESRPKGVMLSSRSLISQYVSCALDGGMSADDIEVHALPMYHCAQLDCFFCVDVYLGATSIILPGPDPAALLAAIAREQVTKLFCPPTVWISLLRHPGFDTTDLSSLRKGYYGASPMPVEILRELQRRLPDVLLWNFYGQTEMAPLATILRPHEQLDRAGSAGRAALNVETIVVDDDGNRVPPGEVGEIVHRSPHAALGYYNDEDKTAEAFRGGWFHSGDLGVMTEDGYLSRRRPQEGHDQDRRGERRQPRGRGGHLRTRRRAEVAVFGISHPHWVEAVTAVVVAQGRRHGHRRGHQSARQDPPGRLQAPQVRRLGRHPPKNPSGKILKRELRQQHANLATADP